VLVFTRESSRGVDRAAVEEFGIPSIVLMENASLNVAIVAEGMVDETALVVCGPGNNGGDGFAVARHLRNAGHAAAIALAFDPVRARGDAKINLDIVRNMNIPMHRVASGVELADLIAHSKPSLVVDALLGTGVDRRVDDPMLGMIGAINDAHRRGWVRVLAIDTPSGLDVDRGGPLGDAVRADATVSFLGVKRGFLAIESRPYVGDIFVADIGAPAELVERLGRADERVERLILSRRADQKDAGEPGEALGRNRA